MSITIRPAVAADFPAIAEITNHYILNTAIHFGYDPQTAEEMRSAWETNLATYPFLVAIDDTLASTSTAGDSPTVIGYARAYRWRERAAYARTAETGIYLRPDLCRRGIGRTLYAALIQACREHGLHTLIGGIALPNEPSIALHTALGFTHAGTCREVGHKFKKWHDLAFYQMIL